MSSVQNDLNSLRKLLFLYMISFIKRHKISITLLILSTIFGFIVLMRVTSLDIWRIEYEFKIENESKLHDYQQVDTVFEHNGIVCRNFVGSISDTLVEEGIRRYELKVFISPPSEDKIIKLGNEVLASRNVKVFNNRYRRTQRDKRGFLYWILFGFFLGMVAEFIIALTKKPSSK